MSYFSGNVKWLAFDTGQKCGIPELQTTDFVISSSDDQSSTPTLISRNFTSFDLCTTSTFCYPVPTMSHIMVDVEADGPIPGDYSMISFGAVIVDKALDKTFYAQLKPISDKWIPEALKVSGFSREETLKFDDPASVMAKFRDWIKKNSKERPMFISDNNGFDWMFICWYFHHLLNENPFGHSSTNLGSLYKGVIRNTFKNFKHLRKTKHSHNALDDAKGNAEAMLAMMEKYNLNIKL